MRQKTVLFKLTTVNSRERIVLGQFKYRDQFTNRIPDRNGLV